MTRLLVLGEPSTAAQWSRRLRRVLTARSTPERARHFDAVLVVNDHSPASVAHLREALALKRQRPELSVAVLSVLPPEHSAADADPTDVTPHDGQAPLDPVTFFDSASLLAVRHPELAVGLRNGVLTFEYCGIQTQERS